MRMRPRAKATKEPKLASVFSQRSAMRLKRLSLPTSCSMHARARLLDARPSPIERLRKESWSVLGRGLVRDHRADAPLARCRTIGLAVVPLVAHPGPRRDVGPKIEQDLELRVVARLALCEVEGQRQALQVDLEVDLGREAAP